MTNDDQELLDGNRSAEYLSQKWGIPYSNGAFRAYRFRLAREGKMNIDPVLSSGTSAWFRKSDLDKLPKPDRSRTRGPRKKKGDSEGKEGRNNSGTWVSRHIALAV